MRLGKYFTKKEFERSSIAAEFGIDNTMTDKQIENAKALVKYVLDPLREYLGKPIIVSSGVRSDELNKHPKIKGAKNSQHLTGEAADIKVDAKAFNYICKHLPFDQLIWEYGSSDEPQWVHVSYSRTNNRREVLRAIKRNGKTVYLKMLRF